MPTKIRPDPNRKTSAAAAKALAVASPVGRAAHDTSAVALLAQGSPEIGHNGGPPLVLADFLTEEELCEQLHIHARTLKRWRDLGRGPPRTILPGRRAVYSAANIASWLRSLEERREPPRKPGRPAGR